MATELAAHLETSGIRTQQQLLQQYQAQTQHNELTQSAALQLVNLLGGMNTIMSVMLSSSNYKMSIDDRKLMQQYLDQMSLKYTSPALTEDDAKMKWTLITNNNMLYQISPWISAHLYSKWAMIVLAMSQISLVVLWFTRPVSWSFTYLLMGTLSWVTMIPWTFAVLLSVNKEMIPRIATTVDAWIKTAGGILMGIYLGIYASEVYDNSYSSIPRTFRVSISTCSDSSEFMSSQQHQ